jgi:hypothetical protein
MATLTIDWGVPYVAQYHHQQLPQPACAVDVASVQGCGGDERSQCHGVAVDVVRSCAVHDANISDAVIDGALSHFNELELPDAVGLFQDFDQPDFPILMDVDEMFQSSCVADGICGVPLDGQLAYGLGLGPPAKYANGTFDGIVKTECRTGECVDQEALADRCGSRRLAPYRVACPPSGAGVVSVNDVVKIESPDAFDSKVDVNGNYVNWYGGYSGEIARYDGTIFANGGLLTPGGATAWTSDASSWSCHRKFDHSFLYSVCVD